MSQSEMFDPQIGVGDLEGPDSARVARTASITSADFGTFAVALSSSSSHPRRLWVRASHGATGALSCSICCQPMGMRRHCTSRCVVVAGRCRQRSSRSAPRRPRRFGASSLVTLSSPHLAPRLSPFVIVRIAANAAPSGGASTEKVGRAGVLLTRCRRRHNISATKSRVSRSRPAAGANRELLRECRIT
jgi:hypothetical protein